MDSKVQLHLHWVTYEIKKYEDYHNHKELMAWLATAFYVTGTITLGFYLSNETWTRALANFGILLIGYLIWIFVNMQFNMRWKAADIQHGLMKFASELCCESVSLPTKPEYTESRTPGTNPEDVFPNHIQGYIGDLKICRKGEKYAAIKDLFRRPFNMDNRWKTELPSYGLIIIATITTIVSLWVH